VVVGRDDREAACGKEAGERSVAGSDLQTGPSVDQRGERVDQLARIEAVDALWFDQRHDPAALPQQRPERPEPEQGHRLALQVAREQELLGDEAVDEVQPDLARGDARRGSYEKMPQGG